MLNSKKDPRVDAYIQKAAPFAKPILNHLRKIVRTNFPQAQETIKWGSPFYVDPSKKILCGMGTFKEHCKFWVKNWKSIVKDQGEASKIAMEKMLHIYKVSDLPNSKTIVFLLKHAVQRNEPGAKKSVQRKVTRKPPLKTPADLTSALKKSSKSFLIYKALSPSHQRHYVDWVTDAKTEKTREARIEKAIKAIVAGKTRHWE